MTFGRKKTGVDKRKRAREDYSVIDLETTAAPMNPPPCTPPQFISSRQTLNVVSTGLRLSQGQSQSIEQRSSSSPMIDGNFAGEINGQADELDRFLQTQVTIFLLKYKLPCKEVFSKGKNNFTELSF